MELLICVGSSCHLKGSEEVIKRFREAIEREKLAGQVEIKGSFCMGQCSDAGVTVKIGDLFHKTTPSEVGAFVSQTLIPALGQ